MDEQHGLPFQLVERQDGALRQLERPASGPEGVFRRIWKYRFHYVIVIPALLLLVIFKLIPFLQTAYASFLDFQVFKGITGSPWVGLDNYRHFFQNPSFRPVFYNTLLIKLGYIGASGMIALVLALAISSIGSARLRATLTTLFLMPYFVPSLIVAYIAMLILSINHSPLGIHWLGWAMPQWFKTLYIAVEVLKTFGIPTFIAAAAISAKHAASEKGALHPPSYAFLRWNLVPALKAVTAFMLMQLSTVLSTNYELIRTIANPLVYSTGDTLENLQFRLTFQNMDLNAEGPLFMLQFCVQLVCTLLAYFIVRGAFAKDLFTPDGGTTAGIRASGKGRSAVGLVVSLLFASVVLYLLYLLLVYPFTIKHEGPSLSELLADSNYVMYLLLYLASSAVFMLMTVTLSFPLTVKNLPGRGLYKGFLLVILSIGSLTLFEYIHYRNLHMVNTVFPLYISGFFSILPCFILKSIYTSKHGALRAQYEGRGESYLFFQVFIPKVWKPLLALGAMQFVALWSSSFAPMILLANSSKFPPIWQYGFLELQGGNTLTGLLQFGVLIALPPLLILLLMRRWLTAEVLTGQVRNL